MPLFSRKVATPPPAPEPERKSMFGRRHTPPSHEVSTTTTHRNSGSGIFHRHEDATITAARERIRQAEAAEKDADRALLQARAAVKDAREQVRILEREAAEE